jgi:hypothetical protein
MAVSVVITSATLKPDGYMYVIGTVAGAPVSLAILLTTLLALPLAQIQNYIALQMCAAANVSIAFASLAGTVSF